MAFNWWNYLELAEAMLADAARAKGAKKEALLRSAISRTYYAALISIGDMLASRHGFVIPEASSHQAIKNELAGHFKAHPEYRAFLTSLQGLQTTRTIADYRNPLPDDFDIESRTEEAISDAKLLRLSLTTRSTK